MPKRIGYLYDRLTSWSNLYLSYKKACKHKKSKAETTEWMFNCEKYLFELQTELIEQRYHPQPYKYFVIREPKERVISVAAFRDRVVHHALVNIIEPYFEAIFIKDSYATRKDKGLHLAVQAAQVYARHYGWYLKLDIQKFFASVNHEILLSLINRKIKDPEVMALCRIILGNQTLSMGMEENKGLPVGNLTSQFFANTSGTAYVAFYQYASSSSSWDFGIDDLVIEEDPNITSFPYLEDFEAHADNTLPLGWTRSSLAAGWEVGDDLSSDYFNIPTHTVYAAANDDAGGSGADGSMDILTMPKIDLSGATPGVPILGFDSFYTAEYGQLASIEASTDSITWVSIYDVEDNDAWTTQSVLLTNYMGNAEVYLRFHADDNGTWAGGWAIDNVSISYSTEDTFPPTIAHLPEIGSLLADTPIPIVAEIADSPVLSSGIASAKLFYSTDASTYTEIAMINTEGALYTAAIPGQALGTTISYYIEAVDGAATPNTTTTDVWDFEINDPVTLQYDSGTLSFNVGHNSTFGVMTGFPNPLGAGNYLQINSVSAGMSNAGTANVHVFTYDSEAGVLVDVIPPFSQSFAAGVHLDIPLTNCVTNAEYFYVAFTDVVAPNYIQFDDTQDYYPETHYIIIGAGADISNMVSVEGYGIPGSWLIRANVEPAAISLDTPAVNLAQGSTGVDLSWAAVDGAATYQIYGSDDPYAADPWELVASVTSPAYTYTGTELNKFFKVVAKNDLIISSTSHTKLGNIRTNHNVRLHKIYIKGKRK